MHDGIEKGREIFREEAVELLAELESALLELEETPEDSELVARVFRAMHTLKGSGSMFGLTDVASFTHEIETVYDLVRGGVLPVTRELVDITLSSLDHIAALVEAHLDGGLADGARTARLVESFHGFLPHAGECVQGPSAAQPEDACVRENADTRSERTYRILFRPGPDLLRRGINVACLLDELRGLGRCSLAADMDRVPVLGEIEPEAAYASWEALLTTSHELDAIRDVFIFAEGDCELSVEQLADGFEVNNRAPEDAAGQGQAVVADNSRNATAPPATARKAGASSIRVASDRLDVLADLVGEMVTAQARLSRAVASGNGPELAMVSEEIERLTEELRDNTLSMRMVPIGSTFSRFKRLVRDLAAELGKDVVLVTEGADTELDKTVIERLNDPIVHLIRNSIGHGIEPPATRISAGKPGHGTVKLSAAHSGGYVIIRIKDDGAGMDASAIRRKAVESGLVPVDATLTDRESFALILTAGFSTATEVTGVSGRGVGMDVVSRQIGALRGTVEVDSVSGESTTVTLMIPLTLAIIEGLLVSVQENYFVIPLSVVEECVELDRAASTYRQGRNLVEVRGELVPFISLKEQFGFTGGGPAIEQVVVVADGIGRAGFAVDEVVGEHQTVIKSLGRLYKDIDGISGATILGDGRVALIIDAPKLIRRVKKDEAAKAKHAFA